MLARLRTVQALSLVLAAFSLLACTHSQGGTSAEHAESPTVTPATSPTTPTSETFVVDGGQDGGGGFVFLSEPDEVKQAIKAAFVLAKEPDFTKSVFYSFIHYRTFHLQRLQKQQIGQPVFSYRKSDVVPEFLDNAAVTVLGAKLYCLGLFYRSADSSCPPIEAMTHHFEKVLEAVEVEIHDGSDCGLSGTEPADASVSFQGQKRKICFSVERLRRIPPAYLMRGILALIFHESMHLNGFNETQAREDQKYFGEFLDATEHSLDPEVILNGIADSIDRAVRDYGEALAILQNQKNDSGAYSTAWMKVGMMLNELQIAPYWKTYWTMRIINFEPGQENSIIALQYSIANIIRKLSPLVPCKDGPECKPPGVPFGPPPASLQERIKILFKIGPDIDALKMNAEYFYDPTSTTDHDCRPFNEYIKSGFDIENAFNFGLRVKHAEIFGQTQHAECK